MIAIDDSLSMKEHNLGFFALESLVLVTTALNKVKFIFYFQAGLGKLCVCGIKKDMDVYHKFDEMFTKESFPFHRKCQNLKTFISSLLLKLARLNKFNYGKTPSLDSNHY